MFCATVDHGPIRQDESAAKPDCPLWWFWPLCRLFICLFDVRIHCRDVLLASWRLLTAVSPWCLAGTASTWGKLQLRNRQSWFDMGRSQLSNSFRSRCPNVIDISVDTKRRLAFRKLLVSMEMRRALFVLCGPFFKRNNSANNSNRSVVRMLDMSWKWIGVSSPYDCRGIHKGLNLHQPEAERSAYCPSLGVFWPWQVR